ncbi:MAG: Glutaminase [Pseudoclavibacter caeni]|jgi:hypothetical protein
MTGTTDDAAHPACPLTPDDIARIVTLLQAAVRRLREAGVPDEALARYEPECRRWMLRRGPRLVPVTRVWRVGALLADAAGNAWLVGDAVRVVEPPRPRNTAVAIERRRRMQELAWQGPFPRGDVVDFDAVPVPLRPGHGETEANPFCVVDGELMIRWDPRDAGTALRPLEGYLVEQTALRIDPFA